MAPWRPGRRVEKGIRLWAFATLGFCLFFLSAGPAHLEEMAARDAGRTLFGKVAQGSENLAAFSKWTGTLERYFEERGVREGSCEESFFTRCHLKEWSRFLEALRGRDRQTQIEEVNTYLNNVSYLTDPINYGVSDYWAVPREHLSRQGDCEDYAIAKFLSLRSLGFSNEDLRVVVLQDLNLRIPHAVLAVYVNDRAFILDNQIRSVVPSSNIAHYRPVYSVNETHWWLYLNP